MEHLALPLTVKKIYSSLCACVCGSWQGLPQPLLQGHGLNFDSWGWLYHSSLVPFFSYSFLSYSFLSLPHTHIHTKAFFITPSLCFFLSGQLANCVAFPDDILKTIQERKKKSAFWPCSAGMVTEGIEQDVASRDGHQELGGNTEKRCIWEHGNKACVIPVPFTQPCIHPYIFQHVAFHNLSWFNLKAVDKSWVCWKREL